MHKNACKIVGLINYFLGQSVLQILIVDDILFQLSLSYYRNYNTFAEICLIYNQKYLA
jgi:hypothetical protein